MITVIDSQSLLDIAIQENGSALVAFELAVANGISVTDLLAPGQKFNEVKSVEDNTEVFNYFRNRNRLIATAPALPKPTKLNYSFPTAY